MYTTLENYKIKEYARREIRGRLWSYWQILLVYGLMQFAMSWILNMVFGKQIAELNAILYGAVDTIPREINYWPLFGYWSLMTVFSALIVPVYYGIFRNVLLWTRGVPSDKFKVLFEKFKTAKGFFKTIGTAVLKTILTALASLLLIVPGIILSLAYSLTPFLLYDEPNLSVWQTLKKSMDMMKGYKGKLFLLLLSFVGWLILGAFTFGFLYIWLYPYIITSFAMFYDDVRRSYYGDDPAMNPETRSRDFTPSESDDSPFSGEPFIDDAPASDKPFDDDGDGIF